MFFDEKNSLFILLDGVTRVHSEYDERPYKSASAEVGDIFIDELVANISDNIDHPDPEFILTNAIRSANAKIKTYRDQKSKSDWDFYPATLGVVGLVRGNVLYYVGIGDCLCVLIRNNAKMLFGKEWTLEALDKLAVTKTERYGEYCNHTENALSYTVFNGDDEVMAGISCSFIDLHKGDVLFIASDGISDYIKFEKSKDLIFQHPKQMIELSTKYDIPPFAEYADDKTVIKISF